MTSILAKTPGLKPVTKFVIINTPSYFEDEVSDNIPVPFTVENQVLDINNWSSSVNTFINNGNYDIPPEVLVKVMGGVSKIISLGPNMITYLENMTGGTDIQIVIAPTMTRVQASADTGVDDQPLDIFNSISWHPSEPSGDGYIFQGDSSNDYLASWVFKTPMTISYNDNGTTRYVTFSSAFGVSG